nr:hypothetical protein Iba_chr11cCG1870 [Ipomoea batatas]
MNVLSGAGYIEAGSTYPDPCDHSPSPAAVVAPEVAAVLGANCVSAAAVPPLRRPEELSPCSQILAPPALRRTEFPEHVAAYIHRRLLKALLIIVIFLSLLQRGELVAAVRGVSPPDPEKPTFRVDFVGLAAAFPGGPGC